MIKQEEEENKEKNAVIDEAVAKYLQGKDHARGYRALSRASKERVASMERELIARSLNLDGQVGVAASGAVAGAKDASYECNIVGASKSEDLHGNKYEMLYLMQFPGYEGADDAVKWLPASHLSEAAIDDVAGPLDGGCITGARTHTHKLH